MVRCSITGTTKDQVRAIGVQNLKVMKHSGVLFADLTTEQISDLKSTGATVLPIQSIKTSDMVSIPEITTPEPQTGERIYTPSTLAVMAQLDKVRALTEPPLSGQGMNVAVIDTGIRETHQDINGRVAYRKNYTRDIMTDGFDHGTGIASIILAVAPGCNILNFKVLDSEGNGTTEEVVEALEDCMDLWDTNPEIAPVLINMSIGAVDTGNPDDPLRVACRAALEYRIWLSAAAGNNGPGQGTITSPAVEKYVFATGSVNPVTLKVCDFSSRGPTLEGIIKPDAVFFGENILMASSQSDTATIGKSGTSFSCPFNTGIALLYLQGSAVYGGIAPITGETPEFGEEIPPGLDPGLEVQISLSQLIDDYLGNICIKPEGAPTDKDVEYGYGIPLGSLVAKAITSVGGISLAGIVPAIMMVGMMGMVMKTMVEGNK